MNYHVSVSNSCIPALRRMTESEMRSKDEAEDRFRVPSMVAAKMIGMFAALHVLSDNNPDIAIVARKCGVWRDLRCAEANLYKALKTMMGKISCKQVRSITDNIRDAKIEISSCPVEGCVNLTSGTVDCLCGAANYFCKNVCVRSDEESKDCPLRQAFDTVPGILIKEEGAGMCPYAMYERHE